MMAERVQSLVASDHPPSHVHAARDRILRSAFLIDLYGVTRKDRLPFGPRKTLRDDIRMLKDRVRVDGGLGRIA